MVETISQNTGSYQLNANPTNATVHPGQSVAFTITATPTGSISSTTLSFSCGSLPVGLTCVFTPASITLAGTQAQATQLVVTASPTILSMADPDPRSPFSGLPLWASFTGMLFGSIVLEGTQKKNRRAALIIIMLIAVLASTVFLAGCATGGAISPHTSHVSKTVQVVATGAHGTHVQTIQITVAVQQ
jgi:hypothetical protein